jgi:hypothetical protein
MSDPLLDELPILRELAADLRAAAQAANSRETAGWSSRRRQRRWSLAVATTTLAGIAAALVVGLQGGDVTLARATAVLHRVAYVAEHRPGAFPRDDQFYYLRSIDTYWQTLSTQPGTSGYSSAGLKVRLRVEQQLWFSAGRIGLTRSRVLSIHFPSTTAHRAWVQAGRPSFDHPAQRIATLGADRYLLGDLQLTRRQLLTFTTDPRELYRRLYAAGGSAHEVFVEIGDQLRNRPTPAPLRAALYRALALVPGIRLVGATTDSIGRHGQAVAFTDHGVADELIFDPNTATMLEERTVAVARNPLRLAAGTVIDSTTYIQRAITDKIAAP